MAEITEETKAKQIDQRQKECPHPGPFIAAGQQVFKNEMAGIITVLTTLMCPTCGRLFFNRQDTSMGPMIADTTPAPDGIVKEEKKDDKPGAN